MKNNHWFYPFLYVIPLLLFSIRAQAITWDGGGVTLNWNEALNWSNDMIPTASDNVEIGAFVVNIPTGIMALAHDLTLNGSTLNIASAAFLIIETGSTYALVLNSAAVINDGDISITNCTSAIRLMGTSATLLDNNGVVSILNHNGYGLRIESSMCTIDNAGILSMDNGTSAFSPAISYGFAQANFSNSGLINIGITAHVGTGIGFANSAATFNNSGTVNIFNTGVGKGGLGQAFLSATWNNTMTGKLNFGAGIGDLIFKGANLEFINNGQVNTDKVGDLDLFVSGNGSFGGSAVFSITNQIEVASTSTTGCLSFLSGLKLSNGVNTVKTNIQLGGTTACSQHDKINVTGNATIAGNLIITLVNGFTPTAGQSFVLLEATTLSGTFASINYPAVNGIVWTTAYNGTSVIVTANSILPVELIYFKAKRSKTQTALIEWQTATESNNQGFQIERSLDGHQWVTIGFIAGMGTTQQLQSYSFEDIIPIDGINYYRLLQLDFNNKQTYSNIITLRFKNIDKNKRLQLFPNPTKNIVYIENNLSRNASFLLFNSNGELVLQKSEIENNQINISSLPKGLYLIKIVDRNVEYFQKLIKY